MTTDNFPSSVPLTPLDLFEPVDELALAVKINSILQLNEAKEILGRRHFMALPCGIVNPGNYAIARKLYNSRMGWELTLHSVASPCSNLCHKYTEGLTALHYCIRIVDPPKLTLLGRIKKWLKE